VIHLKVLNGNAAGAECVARRFPFRIGRSQNSDFRVEADGVWEHHLDIELHSATGFVATVQPQTSVTINGRPAASATLRNGDVLELGAARIRFSLSPTRLRTLRLREVLTWMALAALFLCQIAVIYWLME
jgi:pSer/pThr/pTyr-binding forkhead associated (FHA) protein